MAFSRCTDSSLSTSTDGEYSHRQYLTGDEVGMGFDGLAEEVVVGVIPEPDPVGDLEPEIAPGALDP